MANSTEIAAYQAQALEAWASQIDDLPGHHHKGPSERPWNKVYRRESGMNWIEAFLRLAQRPPRS